MIKYIGSKRQLISWIMATIKSNFPNEKIALDLFSGTSRVGYAFKQNGFEVHANDHNLFAYHIANCYVATSIEELPEDIEKILSHLNTLQPKPGFFTENYCEKSRFFHPKNGGKIDAIRAEIDNLSVSKNIKSVLLVSLMEAADRIDSTCGIQMAYLKSFAKRAYLDLHLRLPKLLPKGQKDHNHQAYCLEASDAASTVLADIAYLDPPYNQHSYRGNYHIWETLVRYDDPKTYGVVQKREDCKTVKSDFNFKSRMKTSLKKVLDQLRVKHIALSFNDEGFINQEEMEELLGHYGEVRTFGIEHKRYVGAQIGVYNPKGEKVGKAKKLHNRELLYLVSKGIYSA